MKLNFYLNKRGHLFTVRVAGHWHRLPAELVGSPSVETSKTCLGAILRSVLWMTLLAGGWSR